MSSMTVSNLSRGILLTCADGLDGVAVLKLISGVTQLRELSAVYGAGLDLGDVDLDEAKYSRLMTSVDEYFAGGEVCVFDGEIVAVEEADDGAFINLRNASGETREFHFSSHLGLAQLGTRAIVRYLKLPPSRPDRTWSPLRVFEIWLILQP